MTQLLATARAHPNIAFIKYWGNRDNVLRLPANGSISMNLKGLETVTTVRFLDESGPDCFFLQGQIAHSDALTRVSHHLNHLRKIAGTQAAAEVISHNNFPTGTGIASSASAFAALTLAASAALGLNLTERELSSLARLGSGSASRSIPSGFVEWYVGADHSSSYAQSIAPAESWPLIDLVAIVSREHKAVGSTSGHVLAPTSPLQSARLSDTPRRLDLCRRAILERNFDDLAAVVEHDALTMHAVMMTSIPALMYWLPPTLKVMEAVQMLRAEGLPICFTIDAGPNVHVITPSQHAQTVHAQLTELEGVESILIAEPGGPTERLSYHLPADAPAI